MNKSTHIKNTLIATIDIGTNSLLMLGAHYQNKRLKFLFDHYFMPRLGEGFAQSKTIKKQATERANNNLQTCKKILDDHQQPYHIFITASSAIREAKNQKEVVSILEKVFSYGSIEIISGKEEARLSYLSLKDCYPMASKNILFDIGGGSTEIAFGHQNDLKKSQSIKFGTVKLLDMFFKPSPSLNGLHLARQYILKQLTTCTIKPPANTSFYGTAGSFTQSASKVLQLKTYSPDQVNGFKLSKKNIADSIKQILPLSIDQIKRLPGIDPERADVTLPGFIIIECLMHFFKTENIEVYDRGIRYGKLFDVLDHYSG